MKIATRVCCARLKLHLVRTGAEAHDEDRAGVELQVVVGSSDPNMVLGDQVMLVDADDEVVSSAKMHQVPEMKAAIRALVLATYSMFGREELRATSLPKTDGTVH